MAPLPPHGGSSAAACATTGGPEIRAAQYDDRRLAAAGIGWCALVALLDWALGGSAVLISFLSTGPLLIALRARPRIVALVGAVAVALAVGLGPVDSMFGSTDHLIRVAVVASISALAVWIAVAREGLERARFRYRLLAEAGAVMTGALDFEVTLIEFARLCARRLSDWCFVFIREDDGSIRQVAAAHVDPERQRLAWELLVRYPLDPGGAEGPAKVIRSGVPDLHPVVGDDLLRAIAADEENLRLLKALGLRSAMVTPLVARGRILGAVAFASAGSERVFGPEDMALAEELSSRAAVAVDNARLYVRLSDTEQELRRSHVQLQAILDGVADAVTAQDAAGALVYANDAAARQLGLESAGELMTADLGELIARYEMTGADGRPFPFDDLPGRRALRGEDPEPALVLYHNRDTGEERWSQIKAAAVRDDGGRPMIAINVVEDVTEQREREEHQRLLADVSGALAVSLDVTETLPRVAELAAGRIADWCAIELIESDGGVLTLAFAHADPEQQPLADELIRRYPPASPVRLRGPLAEGRSELLSDPTDEQLAAVARHPEHLGLLLMLHPRSTMTVPLVLRGRVLGVITLGTSQAGRRLDAGDLQLVEELARRCALALDNARLYDERSQIARTLQESLLPPLLPDVPGIDVAARFRAAGTGIDVGGDFYDLFEVGDAGWAVAIGDVCGKGTKAAAVTALARHTVRAAAIRHDDPSQILELLNQALLRQSSDRRFCTVLFGRVARNGQGVSFEFASGGHPLPLLLNGSDGGRELGAPGTLLGIVPDPALRDDQVKLMPGDAVVLYTDGVTDAGAPAWVWTPPTLAAAIGTTVGLAADEIAERVLRAALDATSGEPRDDIAIIVLKVPEEAAV